MYLVGLDIGSTNIKAVVYDAELGKVIDIASHPTPTDHPQPDWSQHEIEQIWQTVVECIREAVKGRPVSGLGVASLAEAGVPLDAAGKPLHPVIAWYDRRTDPQATWIEDQIGIQELHAITGQRVSTSFTITKILWIIQNHPEAAQRMVKWLGVPDYVLWRLTGEMATDYSLASRTLLFDQSKLDWSDKMLNLAGIKREMLPALHPGGTVIGQVTPAAAAETGLPVGLPCALGGHDHLVGSFAAGAHQSGSVMDSSGTAQALFLVTPSFHTSLTAAQRGFACYTYVLPDAFVVKGGMKAAGGGIEWVARQLAGVDVNCADLPFAELEAAAREGVGKRVGPVWLPHLNGSGSPESDRYSRAAVVGMQMDQTSGDLFRGFLESMAFYMRYNLNTIQNLSKQKVEQVILVGGTTRLTLLSQLKADVLNLPVITPNLPEAVATGAALLAGLGVGVFHSPSEAVGSLRYGATLYEPDPTRHDWYMPIYEQVYKPLYMTVRGINHHLAAISGQS